MTKATNPFAGLPKRATRKQREQMIVMLLQDERTPVEIKQEIVRRKQEQMFREYQKRRFVLGGMPVFQDTYKRFMSLDDHFALKRACYTLTFRRGLPEAGAGDELIMSGHEQRLPQLFHKPFRRSDIEIMRYFFKHDSNVKALSDEAWDRAMAGQGDSIRLPMNAWGFPGGQAFLKGVPAIVVESEIGMIASLPECTFDSYFIDVGQATKNALMADASLKNAEFGPRAAADPDLVIGLTWNRYVGSGGRTLLTSSDMSELVLPKMAKACGTIGHEQLSAHMRLDRPLQESQRTAFRVPLSKVGAATLLLDLIDTLTIGMEDFLLMMEEFPNAKVGGRVDSGNIKHQCVVLDEVTRAFNHPDAPIVFEDEVTPVVATDVIEHVREETGTDASRFIPGAGGYHYKLTRDDLSAKYARSATEEQPNMKFGNAGEAGSQESTMLSGKQSIPGWIRVYGQGDTMIVADKSEVVDGQPLYVQLIKNGRIVYPDWLDADAQAKRCLTTRGRYKKSKLSPKIADWVARYTAMRKQEVAAARARMEAKGVRYDDVAEEDALQAPNKG